MPSRVGTSACATPTVKPTATRLSSYMKFMFFFLLPMTAKHTQCQGAAVNTQPPDGTLAPPAPGRVAGTAER